MPENYSIAYVKNGVLQGIGIMKIAYKSYRIAPLYADNE